MERRRRRDFFDEFFRDIDEEFDRLRECLERIFESAIHIPLEWRRGETHRERPMVYGFSIRIGPDGIPHIQEFGNVKRSLGIPPIEVTEGQEPLTDVIMGKDEIAVTVELPGVAKEDIELNMEDDRLVIHVDTPERKYHKEVELPPDVRSDTIEATYKNGVLDVTIKREKPVEPKGKKVKIK
jgi:HSP20 family protein